MRVPGRGTVLVVGALGLACVYGLPARRYEPALGPRGVAATVWIHPPGSARRPRERMLLGGELMEVRDAGLVVGAARGLVLVPYGAIARATFAQTGIVLEGRPPDPAPRERLRLISRFPQGLSPELLRRILDARHQAQLEEIAP